MGKLKSKMTDQNKMEMSGDTFTITTVRKFEIDFSGNELQTMMAQTEEETPEDALTSILHQREIGYVNPEEKLIGVDINIDESSNE